MAGGANQKFIKDGKIFLRNHIIEVNVQADRLTAIAAAHTDANKSVLATRGRVANVGNATGGAVLGGGGVAAGVYDFDLFKTQRPGVQKNTKNGLQITTSATVYELKEWGDKKRDQKIVNRPGGGFDVSYSVPSRAHPIRAYWTPWSSDSGWSVQLGNDADYFFTPTMDGCSLAISSGANPIVTHGNYRRVADPTKASQTRTLNKMTTHHTTTLATDVSKILLKNQYAASHAKKTLGINYYVTVVGFRISGVWEFYWQRRRIDANHPNVAVVLKDRLVPI